MDELFDTSTAIGSENGKTIASCSAFRPLQSSINANDCVSFAVSVFVVGV